MGRVAVLPSLPLEVFMPSKVHPISLDAKKEVNEFIDLQWEIYKNDPHWVPPLVLERQEHFSPKKNPFFQHATVQLFVARNDAGKVVGRISAQLNSEYDKKYGKGTGFFGFFEAPNDPEVAKQLLAAAEAWCKERGCTKIQGPFNFSINDECGLLVKGFDSPPYLFMAHTPAYYQALVEGNGYQKAKDLIAWSYDITKPIPEPALQITDYVLATPGLKIRNIDMKNIHRDVRVILDVFNSAWSNNWGYVPLTEAELNKLAEDLKLIARPELIKIAEMEGKTAAILLSLPNLNEVIKDLNGCRNPLNFARLLYRVKTNKFTTARLVLLGIKKEFRGGVFAGGSLSVALYVDAHKTSKALGYQKGELGWTLEDNEKINNGIELMGGVPYKIYRIYEKTI